MMRIITLINISAIIILLIISYDEYYNIITNYYVAKYNNIYNNNNNDDEMMMITTTLSSSSSPSSLPSSSSSQSYYDYNKDYDEILIIDIFPSKKYTKTNYASASNYNYNYNYTVIKMIFNTISKTTSRTSITSKTSTMIMSKKRALSITASKKPNKIAKYTWTRSLSKKSKITSRTHTRTSAIVNAPKKNNV